MDIKPKIGRYTWSNNRIGLANISVKIDRFLIHSSLLDGQSIISSKIMPKLLSDHHPILLIFEKEDELGPIPFRFSPLWIKRDGFMDIVGQAWSQYVDSSPSFVWEQKLKRKKLALKTWVKILIKTPTSSR